MPKTICIFSDGTGQGGAARAKTNTNVFTFYQAVKRADPVEQFAFYDPGLGSYTLAPMSPQVVPTTGRQADEFGGARQSLCTGWWHQDDNCPPGSTDLDPPRELKGRRYMMDAPSNTHDDVSLPEVVPPAEWRASFEALLTKEKALTAARDEMSAERRRMPMMRVDTDYRFVGPAGEVSLLDLFEGRRQLIVYRFFYAPDVEGWPEGACSGCSIFADSVTIPRT